MKSDSCRSVGDKKSLDGPQCLEFSHFPAGDRALKENELLY